MPIFTPNQSVEQDTPQVEVEFGPQQGLKVGINRFQLVVVDDAGQESEPSMVEILLLHDEKPTAVLEVLNEKQQLMDKPQFRAGEKFFLTGRRSTDKEPGKITKYRFTWVDRV